MDPSSNTISSSTSESKTCCRHILNKLSLVALIKDETDCKLCTFDVFAVTQSQRIRGSIKLLVPKQNCVIVMYQKQMVNVLDTLLNSVKA